MRAIEITDAFGLDNLKIVERDTGEPGPGEVAVGMRSTSLNYRDLLMVRGHYNPRQPLPLVPLSDGVGVVESVGEGVSSLAVGDRVASMFAPTWVAGDPSTEAVRSTRGGPLPGMLAERVRLPASHVAPVPAHLSDDEAATLPCAALTAWSALVTQGGIRAGDIVLVQGSGGVSTFALDFARMHGASVIATTGRVEKEAWLRGRGASHVVRYDQDEAWGKTVRKLTGGRGVDHVVEVGGVGTMAQSLRAVRAGGRISLIGVLAGVAAKLDLTAVLMNNVRVQGVFVGHAQSFAAMTRAMAAHEYRPPVDRAYGFEEYREAFDHLASGQHRGKVCIRVGEVA